MHRLPKTHQAKLRFLEVGFDVQLFNRNDRHQPRTCLNELPLANGLVANFPIYCGANDGGADIGIGGVKLRTGAFALRQRLFYLGLQ